jgi:Mn2+/Fe2+ NRAMP family transporter
VNGPPPPSAVPAIPAIPATPATPATPASSPDAARPAQPGTHRNPPAHATRGRIRRDRHGGPAPRAVPARAGPPQAPGQPDAGTPGNSGGSSAVLDEAHRGDIEGALGRIRVSERDDQQDDQRRTLRRRLLTFLAIMGPGIIVMVGDNDAGGVSTYAQAGQNYGYSLLWVLLLLIPVLIVNQEMVVRLGAVTGVGHARLINERFGRFWGWFSVGDLLILNFLTIVTEFIGVALALAYFGVSKYVAVPVAAVALILITTTGSFRRWETAMLVFIASSMVLFPLAFMSHPAYGASVYHSVVPGVSGGVTSDSILLIIAIVGTTVAPWQLFFQQSNVIDKRITPRFINHERADTLLGSVVVVVGAGALMIAGAYAALGTPLAGHFTDALGVAHALGHKDTVLGALFSIVLLDASIIGAAAVTLSTSYAFGDFFGLKHSLHRSFRDARGFYTMFTALVVAAAGIVLIPGAPLGVVTEAVQALAGLLLPSASVFLLLLCNDREVLGPWVNRTWLNVVATVIIATLLMLSGTLMATTMFTHLNGARVTIWLAAVLAAGLAATGIALRISRGRRGAAAPSPRLPRAERDRWRMPPLAMLKPVTWSLPLKIAILVLRGYLVIAVLLLLIKAIRLGTG